MSLVVPEPTAPLAPPPPLLARPLAGAALVTLAPLALAALVAPALRVPPLAGIGIAFVVATASIVGGTAAGARPWLAAFRLGIPTAIVGIVLMATGYAVAHADHGSTAGEVCAGLVGSLGVVALGCAIGAMVGARIAHAGHLLAVALASSAADVWSVHAPEGVTHAIVVSHDVALQRLFAVSAAVPPARAPDAVVGLGDVIFAALYVAASARHGLPRGRTLTALALGLLVACACTFVARAALPALPFIGAAVVLAQPRARRVEKRDRFPTLLAGALVLAALVRIALPAR